MLRSRYARMAKPVRLLRAIHLPVGPDVRGIMLISLSIILIWFMVGRVSHFVLPFRLRTVEARNGVIEEAWVGQALAARQESVVHSPASGKIRLLVNEGQRVRTGDVICEVDIAGETGALPVDREKIDQLLKAADADIRAARNAGARKRSELSEQLEAIQGEVRDLQGAGHLEEAQKTEGEQRTIEARLRAVAAAEAEAVLQADMRRQELLRQRESLLGGARSDTYLVRATTSGVVSFQFDGMEGALTLDTPLHDISAVTRESAIIKRSDLERVTAGAPLFRLVNNYHFYLFAAMHGYGELKQGEIIKVYMKEQGKKETQELQMRVARMEKRPDKTLALLASDEFNPGFLNLRHLEVRLSRGKREGVIVPLSSITTTNDGDSGVYVLVEGSPVFASVKTGASDNTHALVDGIPIGARVVTNPKLLVKRTR